MSGASRYIFSTGTINRKDNSLTFRGENGLTHLPIEGIKELYIMNEVTVNTKLLDFLSSYGIAVHFFNYYGHYSGSFYPKDKYLSGRLRVEQAICYKSKRMVLAQAFVRGIQENMIYFLKSKKYKNPEEINSIIHFIENVNLDMEITNIKNLLALEGEMWQYFYQGLNLIIDTHFISDKRVKRPPDNPLNAMISFGNTWLYTKTISQIYHTHLDQCISFLHEPSEGRFSLSLDISEVFKIVVVYPVIINMVNKKMINIKDHFMKEVNYCHLNEAGRKKFVIELEKKLTSTFQHNKLNRNMTYETALKFEGYKLAKYLIEEVPFIAYSEKEGM